MPLITATGGGSVRGLGRARGRSFRGYEFSNFTFTTGKSAQEINNLSLWSEGSRYSDFQTAYSGQPFVSDQGLFSVPHDGIQIWVVPQTATYSFSIHGGSALDANALPSYAISYSQTLNQHRGANVNFTASLAVGDILTFIVGQSGQPSAQDSSAYGVNGGAGASWVFLADGTILSNLTEANLLAVAGGSGGGTTTNYQAHASIALDGSFTLTPAQSDSVGNSQASGGNGGFPGHYVGKASFNPAAAGGGAGVNSNGGTQLEYTPRDFNAHPRRVGNYYGRAYDTNDSFWHGVGGSSPKNGANGGFGWDDSGPTVAFETNHSGGFGGGGGGADNVGAGGGGGGYNGGMGGHAHNGSDYGPGQGGSSFVASAYRGSATASLRTTYGNGFIAVTKL